MPNCIQNMLWDEFIKSQGRKLRLTLINYFRDNIDKQSNQIKEAIEFLRKHRNGMYVDKFVKIWLEKKKDGGGGYLLF
ncbi:MAG: hypothetical protein LBQ37_01970 [Elusimicrobiota bacterium]|nr:hypothetical protein [Elusimicrobiota bacterium]